MGDKFEWLPILTKLGEETVARILDKSPDVKSAILEAHQNFDNAEIEAQELRNRGHEGEGAAGGSDDADPPPTDPGDVDNPGRHGGG